MQSACGKHFAAPEDDRLRFFVFLYGNPFAKLGRYKNKNREINMKT